jgi:hypothetical protein
VADGSRATPTGHARHDPLRVAEAVDRGGRLAPVLRFCDPCGQLYADLVALTTALSLAAIPSRPRDYTLRATDAHRLRYGGLRAWLSVLGSKRDALSRPLAIGLTTLGLGGILLTAIPTALPPMGSGAGAAPDREFAGAAASGAPGAVVPEATGDDSSNAPVEVLADPAATEPSATLALSIGLVAAGGGLFALRHFAAHGRPVR